MLNIISAVGRLVGRTVIIGFDWYGVLKLAGPWQYIGCQDKGQYHGKTTHDTWDAAAGLRLNGVG